MFESFSNFIAEKVESLGPAPLSSQMQEAIDIMPAWVLFVANDLNFPLLISSIVGSFLVRFLIRRIPFFG